MLSFSVCTYVYGFYVTWEIIHMCKSVRYCQFLLVIFWAGSALQSWQWWPGCPSWRGHACWALCRSPCGPETRRRCSCWGASSPWTCTRHGRLSGGGDKETDTVHFNVPRRFQTVMKRFCAAHRNIGLNLDYTHGLGERWINIFRSYLCAASQQHRVFSEVRWVC